MKFKMHTTLSDRPSGKRHRRPETLNLFSPFSICAKVPVLLIRVPTTSNSNMEEKMSNNRNISRNQNQIQIQNLTPKQIQHPQSYTYLVDSIEDQKLQIFSSPLPKKEVLIGTPGIMTRLSRVLFPEAEADVKEASISSLEHNVHERRPARVSMGDRTTKQQSHTYDSLAMLGAPFALGSGSESEAACFSVKSKRSITKAMSSRKERGSKKGKQQQQAKAKVGERKSREHRDRDSSRTSSSTKNRTSRRGRSLDSSAIRRQSLANITNHCDASEKKRKSRRRKSASSRRVSGMDILGNLESLHDIVNQQSDRLKASTRKNKKNSMKAKLKKDRKQSGNTISNICTEKNSSAKEKLNPKSKGPVPARRALSAVTTAFENLPSASNNMFSIVTPLVPEPYLPLAQTKIGPKSNVRKNHDTILKSQRPSISEGNSSILKDGDSSASFSDDVIASSTLEVLISPTITTNSDVKDCQSTIHMSPSKSERTNSTTRDGHSSISADETAVDFHTDEELMSPTIAPRASKRADTKATPIHMKSLNEKENIEPTPCSNHARKQKFANNALLSPSVRPKSTKRVDRKTTPTQNHACQDIKKITTLKSKDEINTSILKKDSKYSGIEKEAPTKADIFKNADTKNRFMSPSTPFMESIDCHSCPKEIFVDLSKMKQDFDLKDGILDLSNSPPQLDIFDENGAEKESATKSVIRRSSRKQTPVNRLVATFKRKRKRKRGTKKVEKGKSTKKTEILDKGNTTSSKSPALKKTPKKESITKSKVLEPKSEATRRSSRSYRPVDRLSLSFKKQRKKKKVVKQVEKDKVKQVEKDKVKRVEKEVNARSTIMISLTESTTSKNQACKGGILLKSSRVSKPPERLTMKHQKRTRRQNKNAIIEEKRINIEQVENDKKSTEPRICDLKICAEDEEESSKRRSSRKSKSIVRFKPSFSNTHTRSKKSKRSKKIQKKAEKPKNEKENDATEKCCLVSMDQEPSEEKCLNSVIPKESYIGLLTKGKRFGDKCIDSPEKISGWNSANIQKLKVAHAEAEPTSHLFWQTIAQKVPGKSAEDCHLKWFAMFASPVRQKKADKNIPGLTHAQANVDVSDDASATDDEDDIFDSTPVRNGSQLFSAFLGSSTPSSLRKSSVQCMAQFSDMFSSPLLLKKKSCAKKIEDIDGASPLTLRNQSKLYMKELKAGIGEKMRVFEPKKKSLQKKGSNDIFESIEDGDMQLGGALSPGGTLRIECPDDDNDDLEQMYSDSNLSISSEMD